MANLSVALTSLRKQLDAYLLAERHTICFNIEADFWLDTAVSLYKGDFLAGFTIRGAPEFEVWALLEQERLRQMLLTALSDLVTFHQQRHQFDEGIRYAQQLLAADSLQEEAHRCPGTVRAVRSDSGSRARRGAR